MLLVRIERLHEFCLLTLQLSQMSQKKSAAAAASILGELFKSAKRKIAKEEEEPAAKKQKIARPPLLVCDDVKKETDAEAAEDHEFLRQSVSGVRAAKIIRGKAPIKRAEAAAACDDESESGEEDSDWNEQSDDTDETPKAKPAKTTPSLSGVKPPTMDRAEAMLADLVNEAQRLLDNRKIANRLLSAVKDAKAAGII